MSPILVFGSGGQVGREILSLSSDLSAHAVGVSHTEVDITDQKLVEQAVHRSAPRLIVNAAAYTAVDRAESEPEHAHVVNALGAELVARAAAAANVPIVHISTDFVFDGCKQSAYREGDAVNPLSVYGRTKAEGEDRVRATAKAHVILRTAWVYGIYGNNFLKTMLKFARERDELRVVSDQRGCPTATADIASAIFAVDKVVAAGAGPWGTYNFAGTGVTSWYGFATKIVDVQSVFTGRRPLIHAIASSDWKSPARRPANSELDSSLFVDCFGYRAVPWQERTEQAVVRLLASPDASDKRSRSAVQRDAAQ